ncbi:acyclic terpene utilization AtuA family protein [Chryseolinea sp. H1M3-3]|uniref:acyclic terpene utilization AtuA family protein n=1 Tax=Chryseolinea sp. H1M3-3 TaxID=3034144 RepID=UPI0023EC5E9B|nr:acyclic terpene utilization AtuA family protein [Chryseolinea sp. H1M3-3]
MKDKIRIGCGAGFSGDRLDPAIILAEQGNLDYLVLECLAERTIALAQKRKIKDQTKGYDPLLERRIESLLPALTKNKVTLITNMGAANPMEAAKKVADIARKLKLKIRIAAVTGDDVFKKLETSSIALETNEPVGNSGELISANAYLGVDGILEALHANASVIITGRIADPSLFLAPMIFEFGWSTSDYDLLGKGTVIGHLLECAGHITGGYFADPVKKPVEGLHKLGHPFADVKKDGSAIISKVQGTGGVVNLMTVKEQLLYEVINPSEYFTPDVIANFTTVKLQEIGHDQVQVTGGHGKPKPETYKVSVGYKAFCLGEGEISYAGHAAFERAKLAGEIVSKRFAEGLVISDHPITDIRVDYIGISSVHRTDFKTAPVSPYEIRLRIVGKAQTPEDAALIGEEVEALYTNGPAAGGGVRKLVNEVVGIVSTLMARTEIEVQITIIES